ncbi:BRISC and BRCA1-A complex member 2-like isoform X4 [Parasteatoda tepidariorum]|uniref:BRISC and BRCA1-A complex member 2-like isoform X4 n=1 Tax=Parasteatoda tepidariorum TaxID=114398 RepID=UPI00077FB925|nr:BRISC and BRCA1-A complex member 2-like isoform X3 [Parasteatoda tepidariorum]
MTDISCFVPHVQKHVEVILTKRYIGLSHEGLVIKNPQPSCPSFEKNANCDRFTVVVPYAGTSVEFIVMFQATQPECPPDFLFSDLKFFVPIDELESLHNWDVQETDGLFKVVKEIMYYYKKKNMEDLEKYTELNYEYLSLFQIRNFSEDDIEVYVPSKAKTPITMLVRLHVEFCDVLPDVTQRSGYESALLLLIFSDRDNEKCSQRLYLSEEIKNALGLNGNFEFPGHMREFQLNRYIVAVEDKLRCQVDLVASRYERWIGVEKSWPSRCLKNHKCKFLGYCNDTELYSEESECYSDETECYSEEN